MSQTNRSERSALHILVSQLGSSRVLSSGPAYEVARRVWNNAVSFSPKLIVLCEKTEDVQLAVRTARACGVSLSVRGGGHDWAGRAVQGQMVIDLTRMHSVQINANVATVAGGATSMEVSEAADKHGLAAVTGSLGAIGLAGFTLGGGYGPLTAKYGMASDSLIGAELVTAEGELIAADETHEPDLLWALRGAGGNFGVVTSFRIKLHPVPSLSAGVIVFPWEQASAVMTSFAALTKGAPDDATVTPAFAPGPDGKSTLTLLCAY